MTASALLQQLRDHRTTLLTCEAIGWLHMAGKAHPEFVRHAASDAPNGGTSWKELTWASSLYTRFGAISSLGLQSITPQDLFEKHRQRSDGVLGLLQAAHAMASGIEKNAPSDYQKQIAQQTWLTTAFGHPVQNLLANGPALLATGGWQKLEQQLGALIDELVSRAKAPSDLAALCTWRDGAIGSSGWLREAFTSTLAETRVPNNDVTLWDQSYVAAALFKAAVAGAVLTSSFEWGAGIKSNTRWRVLTVGIGAEHYESRAIRIGDWTGTRTEIAAFFDEVCALVEVDLAAGACVYRDERTLAFTFPGERLDKKGSLGDSDASALRDAIETCVDDLARKRAFETPPRVQLSASTRSFIVMSRELADARSALEIPVHRPWAFAADGSAGKHVCPVSLARMGDARSGSTSQKQDASKACYDRRAGRRASWERSGGDTIWISEVADDNDRVALLTFSLGVEDWLDGGLVDSLRAQSVVEWRANNASLNAINANEPRSSLRTHVEGFVRSPTTNGQGRLSDPVLASLNDGFALETKVEDFFHKIVEDRAGAPPWTTLSDSQRGAWLTHQLLRKNASPGRVHRFWRTAQTFFLEALAELRGICCSDPRTAWRTQRLELTIRSDSGRLREGEVYAGHLPFAPNAPFEILRRSDDFVTVCNLARALGPGDGASRLENVTFEARGDDGVRRRLSIEKAAPLSAPLASYTPLVVLEENPQRFRVLVPIASADACVEHVVAKWRKEMARVWDRLPLRVGVIGFPRKTPFQAVIEATRNVEDDLAAQPEPWRVASVAQNENATTLCLIRPDGGREHMDVPTQLVDGRDDVYYPNLAVKGAARESHDFDAPRPDGSSIVYRWARELRVDDAVIVAPSRFARVFLESTARRFGTTRVVSLSEWDQQQNVWELVSRCAPSLTAARAVEQSLRETRERWTNVDGELDDAAWQTWTHAVLANEWRMPGDTVQALEEAAQSGLLEQVLSAGAA